MKKIYKSLKSILITCALGSIIWFYVFRYENNIISLFGDGVASEEHEELFIEDFFNQEEYEEKLKSQPSDIEGMTKYDKYVMGLDTADNADSDMDGLTDKEEIEIYGTNPAKPSTSGDLYMDGYKVKQGMDVAKKYEYRGEFEFTGNGCPEIILNPLEAFDFNASVVDRTGSGMYNLPDKNVLKTYFVSLYTGYVTIDLDDIESVKDIALEEIVVYVQKFYETKADLVKYSAEGSRITLVEKYDYNIPYIIYVVQEDDVVEFGDSSDASISVTFGTLGEAEEGRTMGVIYGSPLLAVFGKKLNVVYESKGTAEENASSKSQMVTVANDIQEGVVVTDVTDKCVRADSKKNIEKLIGFFDKVLGDFSYTYDPDNIKWWNSLFIYYTYEDYMRDVDKIHADKMSENEKSNIKYAGDFSIYIDTLSFPNFRTRVGTSGVCAGIAHLTSNLFNNKILNKSSGSFTYNDTKYSWDITTDEENSTLLDRGLSDYKTRFFDYDHKSKDGYLEKNLSDGEENFITLINYFYAKGNAAFDSRDYMKGGSDGCDADKDDRTMLFYDGQGIRNMINEIDSGRIVDAYFLLVNNTGHVVNIYAYEECKTYLSGKAYDGYVFYVYDSNHPGEVGTLTAEIHNYSNGQELLFYRLDLPGKNEAAYSNSGGQNLFVVLDSEFNVLSNQ